MKGRLSGWLSLVITALLAINGLFPNEVATAAEADKRPQMVEHGSLVFQPNAQAVKVSVPLYAIAAVYGADWPTPPSVTPKTTLPPVRYAIPASLQNQLAAYWINDGSDKSGILLLGPKGWRASTAVVGANGSVGITLENPLDPKQKLDYYDTRGGCQGCAISSIGSYFPTLRKWAETEGFPVTTKVEFAQQYLLTPNISVFSLKNASPGYETNGAAFQQHGEGGATFRSVIMTTPVRDHNLATAVLNFFLHMGKIEAEVPR
ncbi:UNVERIFIED_CONTAM: hypothetical protein ABID98_005547 [Brevibacillus sp. OAP136]